MYNACNHWIELIEKLGIPEPRSIGIQTLKSKYKSLLLQKQFQGDLETWTEDNIAKVIITYPFFNISSSPIPFCKSNEFSILTTHLNSKNGLWPEHTCNFNDSNKQNAPAAAVQNTGPVVVIHYHMFARTSAG